VLRLLDQFDAGGEPLKGRAREAAGVVFAQQLLVKVVIGRAEQFAGQAATADADEIALGRLDLDHLDVEKFVEVFLEDMGDGLFLRLKRQEVGLADVNQR